MAATITSMLDLQSEVLRRTLAEIRSSSSFSTAETTSPLSSTTPADPADSCCVICLDGIRDGCVAQPCRHRNFDFVCLASWLQTSAACPLCKAEIVEVRYAFEAPTPPTSCGGAAADKHASPAVQPRERWKTLQVSALRTATPASPHSLSSSSSPPHPPALSHALPLPHRRRRRRGAEASSSFAQTAALQRRREVYARGVYARHVGGSRVTGYRATLTPRDFRAEPELLSRAGAFVRRELEVFAFEDDDDEEGEGEGEDWGEGLGGEDARDAVDHAAGLATKDATAAAAGPHPPSPYRRRRRGQRRRWGTAPLVGRRTYALAYVAALLQTVDTQGAASAGHAQSLLVEQGRLPSAEVAHFLHELRAFLRSPCKTVEEWDKVVQYDDDVDDGWGRGGGKGGGEG